MLSNMFIIIYVSYPRLTLGLGRRLYRHHEKVNNEGDDEETYVLVVIISIIAACLALSMWQTAKLCRRICRWDNVIQLGDPEQCQHLLG